MAVDIFGIVAVVGAKRNGTLDYGGGDTTVLFDVVDN